MLPSSIVIGVSPFNNKLGGVVSTTLTVRVSESVLLLLSVAVYVSV